jgi:hypothetical protein
MASLHDLFEYFEHYDAGAYNVASCQGQEPLEDHVVAFERTIGFQLPYDFREFTKSPLGGLYVEVKEELWPRQTENDAAPFWSFLYGVKVFGIAIDIPPWLDVRQRYGDLQADGVTDLVPFLQRIADPAAYCFDHRGRIIDWTPELPHERAVMDIAFYDLILKELHDLQERKAKKQELLAKGS